MKAAILSSVLVASASVVSAQNQAGAYGALPVV